MGIRICDYITHGNMSLALMIVLGAMIGVPMGLMYPFPLAFEIIFIISLTVALASMIYGFKNNKTTSGQFCVVAGIKAWFFMGLMVLGTEAWILRIINY